MKKPHGNKGRPSPLRGKGPALAWLKANVSHEAEGCLIWPFSRNHQGYGQVSYRGKVRKAHHVMCLLVKGPAPADKPQAAHSCGNGKGGCVHPKHLDWKNNSQNQLDRRAHGSPEGAIGRKTRLQPDQIEAIREAKGKIPQLTLAKLIGVKRGTIEYWQRSDHPPALRKST